MGQALTEPQTQAVPLPFTLTVKGTSPALPSLCRSGSVLLLAFVFYRKEIIKILNKTKQPVPYPKNKNDRAGETCKIGGVHKLRETAGIF